MEKDWSINHGGIVVITEINKLRVLDIGFLKKPVSNRSNKQIY